MNIRSLKDIYKAVNSTFYGGMLPNVSIFKYGDSFNKEIGYPTCGITICQPYMADYERLKIGLYRGLSDLMLVCTLYHEAIHVWQHVAGLPVNHGQVFIQEAKRIAQFLEIDYSLIY